MTSPIRILVLLSLLPLSALESRGQDPVTLLFPRESPHVLKARMASVIGRVVSKDVARLRLLTPARASVWLRLSTKDDKDGFASAVKTLFPDRFILTKAVFTQYHAQSNKENRSEYTFPLESNTGLKEFWSSTQFKELYSSLFRTSLASVRVEIDGWTAGTADTQSPSSHVAATEIFVLSAALVPGRNNLVLQALNEQGRVLQSVPVAFLVTSGILVDSSKSVEKVFFHTTVFQDICAECHPLEIPPAAMTGGTSMKEQCGPCHTLLAARKSVHAPVADWDCLLCHDAAAKQPFALYSGKDYGTAVCGECHGDITEAVEKSATPHFPATDQCMTCHDPHGTDERALLVDKVNTICASCHAEMSKTPHPVANHPLATVDRPSANVRHLDCVSCHTPHESANPKLVRGTGMALCSTCHDY